jgi:hypothetical protein
MLALAAGSAGAGGGVTKRYLAIAVAPSIIHSYSGYGLSKQRAQTAAYNKCENSASWSASYKYDCTGAVWVYNGYASVAFEKTKEPPYKNLDWGWGWDRLKSNAEYYARQGCRSLAQENCVTQYTDKSPRQTTDEVRGGGW